MFAADLVKAHGAGTLRDWLRRFDARCRGGERCNVAVEAPAAPAAPTVGELARRWMDEHVAVRLKPTTRAFYRAMLDRWVLPELGTLTVEQLTPSVVSTWFAGTARESAVVGKSPSTATVNHRRNTLRIMLEWAVSMRLLPTNPAACIAKANDHQVQERAMWLTTSEEAALFARVEREGAPWDTLVPVLARTGIRLGEALALDVGDVDLEVGHIVVRRALSAGEVTVPKGRRAAAVPLPPEALAALRVQVARVEGGLVWPGRKGYADRGTAGKRIADLMADAGIEPRGDRRPTAHWLRHTAAMRFLDEGASLREVSRLLRHADTQVTARVYVHEDLTALHEVARRVGRKPADK